VCWSNAAEAMREGVLCRSMVAHQRQWEHRDDWGKDGMAPLRIA
jgi:hypothetical protein